MKTKEQAAKLLLDAGWTLEEINRVLGDEAKEVHHYHYPPAVPYWIYYPQQWQPSPPVITWDYTISAGTSSNLYEP